MSPIVWLKRFRRNSDSLSRPIVRLGWGFAILAAATSSLGAWVAVQSMGLDYTTMMIAAGVLIALSIGLVSYERSALSAIRSRRLRNDNKAAFAGMLMLIAACTYTAVMQLTFFGSVFMGAQAKDQANESALSSIDKRIAELEKEKSWQVAVFADPDALELEIKGLEATLASKSKEAAAVAARAQANVALPQKRSELSAVRHKIKIDRELADLHQKRTVEIGKPPADPKAKMLGTVLSMVGLAVGDKFTYALILLGVGVIQMGQILLPSIAGKSELIASRAAAASLAPPVEEATVELVPVAEKKPEKSLELMAVGDPPRAIAPPVINPLGGPMAQAALAAIAAREKEKAKPRKAPSKPAKTTSPAPAPAPKGLASKFQ
jgi:hypothetical protein